MHFLTFHVKKDSTEDKTSLSRQMPYVSNSVLIIQVEYTTTTFPCWHPPLSHASRWKGPQATSHIGARTRTTSPTATDQTARRMLQLHLSGGFNHFLTSTFHPERIHTPPKMSSQPLSTSVWSC